MKLGIAFSGGGARAAAQLGIVKALHEAGIVPTIFTGTSGGSICATLMALGIKPDVAIALFKQTHNIIDVAYGEILKGIFTKAKIEGLVKGDKLEQALNQIFDGNTMRNVIYPYAVVSTDINSGQQIIFSNIVKPNDSSLITDDSYFWYSGWNHNLHEIVRASCSFPGVFIPKLYYNHRLVDGGLTNNLPADIAKALGADKVIGISLANQPYVAQTGGIISILSRSFDIIFDRDEDNSNKDIDVYLNPDVDSIGLFDTEDIDIVYTIGYTYGKAHMTEIKTKLGL